MVNILVNTEVETWTTRERDPHDSWDNGDTAGRVSNVTASITDHAPTDDWGYDSIVKEMSDSIKVGQHLYAVVADYESGSTFGRSGGYAQVLDVFETPEEATALQSAAIGTPEKNGRGWEASSPRKALWPLLAKSTFEHEGKEYNRNWIGYFEALNSIDVWIIEVRPDVQTFLTPLTERTFGRIKHGS